MKIIDRKTTSKGVEIIVKFGKKEFLRIKTNKFIEKQMNNVQVVEWKRVKTNHLVGKDESEKLEKEFEKVDTTIKKIELGDNRRFMSSGSTIIHTFETSDKQMEKYKKEAEKLLRENPTQLLATVKFLKDKTGLGLKDCKNIVDEIYARIKTKFEVKR